MKRVTSLLTSLLMIGTMLMVSCHGTPDEEPQVEPTDPKTEVPDGVLRIFADKQTIAADGSDDVTFTVMYGKEDVSSARTLQLIRNNAGKETYMGYGINTFTTLAPGEYVFSAKYYHAGEVFSDNNVTIVAESTVSDGEQKNYAQKCLGLQFTSIGCVNCPTLSESIKTIEENMPGKMIPVSFHRDFKVNDPMAIPMADAYYKRVRMDGLPVFNLNLIVDYKYTTTSSYSIMAEMLNTLPTEYPATCGVAIESSMEVGGSSTVDVKVKVTSNTPSAYRYQIFLVEDGIMDAQEGHSGYYEHNNVLRATSSESIYGDRFNDGMPLQVGVEAFASRTLTIPAGCNVENMRIVVAMFVSYDGGNTYVVNNCAECDMGHSVDYEIN